MITNKEKVKERWKEYYQTLLNEERKQKKMKVDEKTEGPIEQIRREEIIWAMQKAGTGKSPGADGIPIEVWKALGDEGVKWLTWFLNRIVKEMKMPNKWRESKIIPIFKRKGDAS